MEAAVMGSSSCIKLVSCSHKVNNLGVLFNLKDGLLGKSYPLGCSNNNHTNKAGDFNLSISFSSSRRGVPMVVNCLNMQAEVDDHELLIEESTNGYAETEIQTVRVQFQLQRECSFGQNFLITGDHPILGSWDPNNAISLTWSDGHIWTADLDIPVGICIKFKLMMQESNGKFVWQPGPDRVLECFQTDKIITLCEDWENPDSRMIIETDPTVNQEVEFVEPSTVTQEPKEYEISMKEVLVSDEVVPVLVPGLSQLPVNEGPDDEPETVNGAAMVSAGSDIAKDLTLSAGPDMVKDLTLPELVSKEDIANTSDSNPNLEISSIQENQESCENDHQEMQVAEEQDHQDTQQMTNLLHNDIQWSNNVMQKFLNIFGIQ